MLYIIRGIPGSGKSTFARKMLKEKMIDDYFEADMYFEIDGKYQFDRNKLGLAHKWCYNQVEKALKEGKNVAVSNTFTKLSEIYPYTDLCEDLNEQFKVIRLTTNFGSIHNVPEETIQKMKTRFQNYPGETLIK